MARLTLSSSCLRPIETAQQVYIAYSGGVDSHVLLHLCATQPTLKKKITAVYVHHGLQKIADEWAIHCQQHATDLEVAFKLLRVKVNDNHRKSPEEAAREARYHALKNLLNPKDVLLVAQHREDQLETLLLQLFRGAGIQGLSAMADISLLSQGKLLRPLLNHSQQALKDYAIAHHLNWVEDPSNQYNQFERNFLRNKIIPLLKTHWPSVDKTVARSAQHCADAHAVLTQLSAQRLNDIMSFDQSLSIQDLFALNSHEQALVIRQWFSVLNLKMPRTTWITQLLTQFKYAKQSAMPLLIYGNHSFRRYQNQLYCLSLTKSLLTSQYWLPNTPQLSLSDQSILQRIQSDTGISQAQWHQAEVSVHYRKGGEKITLPDRKGHHTLKKLCQEAKIPPWERKRLPLLYFNETLIAIADLWVSSKVLTTHKNQCYQLKWRQ